MNQFFDVKTERKWTFSSHVFIVKLANNFNTSAQTDKQNLCLRFNDII